MLLAFKLIKLLAAGFVVFTVLDIVWIGVVASNLYHHQIGHLLNLVDGEMKADVPAALATWVLVVAGIVVFVLPKIPLESPLMYSLLWGGLYGFIVYGVYDLTNYAVLRNWPLAVTLIDIAWGTFACAVTAWFLAQLERRLS